MRTFKSILNSPKNHKYRNLATEKEVLNYYLGITTIIIIIII